MVQPSNKRLVTEESIVKTVQSIVSAMIVGGSNVTTTYNSATGKLTISTTSTGGSTGGGGTSTVATVNAGLVDSSVVG